MFERLLETSDLLSAFVLIFVSCRVTRVGENRDLCAATWHISSPWKLYVEHRSVVLYSPTLKGTLCLVKAKKRSHSSFTEPLIKFIRETLFETEKSGDVVFPLYGVVSRHETRMFSQVPSSTQVKYSYSCRSLARVEFRNRDMKCTRSLKKAVSKCFEDGVQTHTGSQVTSCRLSHCHTVTGRLMNVDWSVTWIFKARNKMPPHHDAEIRGRKRRRGRNVDFISCLTHSQLWRDDSERLTEMWMQLITPFFIYYLL